MFLKNTYVNSKVFNCSGLCWRCQVALLGAEDFLVYVGQETQLPFKAERKWKKWQFLKLIWEKWGEEGGGRVFLFNMVIYRFENLSISLWIRSFILVFYLVTESTKYTVHSPVPIGYRWTHVLWGYILLINQVSCSIKNGETQSKILEINFQTF